MSVQEYETLRVEMPWLALPRSELLWREVLEILITLNRETLVAGRTARVLASDWMDPEGFTHRYPVL